ncbi:D-amino acid aminotransferase [Silvimonas sp. JCM 19000]
MQVPELIAYLNGAFAPLATLQVPVLDRGFLFGDGVYEVIPVYSRRPFRLQEHIHRLGRSLAAARIDDPHSEAQWLDLVHKLVAQQPFDDQSVYLQVTRGPAYPRNHVFPNVAQPTVFAYADPLIPPAPALVQQGVSAVSADDIRWLRCNVKATSLLANVLLRQMAADAGVTETVLFRDGLLIEGSASNIFVVRDGQLLAPPPSHLMLTGITYDLVLELAQQHQIPHQQRAITAAEVSTADELWLSSSSKELLAITELDDRKIGNGQPGPLYRAMYQHYLDFKRDVMRAKDVP